MALAQAMWLHGHSLEVEYTQRGQIERKGFSAEYTAANAAQANWLHFAIPTPVIVSDKRLKVGSVLVRFKSHGEAYVKAIHVYDGEKKISSKDKLNLSPKQWHVERVKISTPSEIKWGIGVSILVDFGPDVRVIEFSSAGCDFIQ
jgi:hypothetical protein